MHWNDLDRDPTNTVVTAPSPLPQTLSPFISSTSLWDVAGRTTAGVAPFATVVAYRQLQDIGDYRAAIRQWFDQTAVGGHLILTVPHAFLFDRVVVLPSPWIAAARRLYAPSTLAREIEETLVPNTYRLRLLQDDDRGYDYARSPADQPTGPADIIVVVEKIAPPEWLVEQNEQPLPNPKTSLFFPPQTRSEALVTGDVRRIVALKLDHLGDFLLGLAALRRLRDHFPDAIVTLVVGSWNAALARECGLADEVIAFDAFPRNAGEEQADVWGQRALFAQQISDRYDLAIDLRSDPDTRALLQCCDARIRAGLGTSKAFPFLDIFLPIDLNRHGEETSLTETVAHRDFGAADVCFRNEYRIGFEGTERPKRGALIWGPYRRLRPGDYLFEPMIEIEPGRATGKLTIDIVLNGVMVLSQDLQASAKPQLPFAVDAVDSLFESRIWAPRWKAALPFSYYGGRLYRQGSPGVLHQSEYLTLLVELVAQRVRQTGVLVASD